MLQLLALLLAVVQGAPTPQRLEVAPLFGSGMVLQCEREGALWGTAPPGASVGLAFTGPGDMHVARVRVQKPDGRWIAEVPALPAGGPWTVKLDAGEHGSAELRDVWFGDVWICSGQSNMEWPLAESANAESEIAAATQPRVRLFQVEKRVSAAPQAACAGKWTVCDPQSAASFSAVGYHFGSALARDLERPIGLIQAAWGGTPAEAWTMRAFLDGEAFAPILERAPPHESWTPCGLFNGMIAPLAQLSLRGAIWYQGESNAERAEQYRELFPAMIRSWRQAFGREDLPFLFVQLASFKPRQPEPGESDWAELREAQAMALALPHTGMALAIDVGDAEDIHPRDKRTVGERLALEALRVAYGRDVASRGPTFRSLHIDGGSVRVELDHAEGLATTDGGPPAGFALAGEDRVFHWAEAELTDGAVVLRSPAVPTPVAVRFAWADNPAHNLKNAAGLPAVPFRTDDWPGVTAGRR
jgi:sialate O-acetylesterase